MTSRRKSVAAAAAPSGTPAQQNESDIAAEIGAVPVGDGSGEMEVDEAKLLEAGAVDAESIRENRRIDEMVNKKRSGQQGVQFNVDDPLEKYEGIIKYWPPNTMDILVKRVTGTPIQWVITSRPRSGAELYAAIKFHHGRYEEATYNIVFFDSNDKQRRGTTRITIPDTRDTPPTPQTPQSPQTPQLTLQGQQPMFQAYPPQSTPPAPSVDPVAMMQSMFQMFQQMQSSIQQRSQPGPVVPQPGPAPVPASLPGISTDPVAMMQQMFQMFQQMQTGQQPQSQPQPIAAPQAPSTDPMAMMQTMFRMFQEMQPGAQVPAPPSAPPAPQAPATDPVALMQQAFQMFQKLQAPPTPASTQPGHPQQTPPVQAPPGMFFVPGFGFVPAERLFAALGTPGAQGQGPGPGGPGGPGPYRPAYGGGGTRPYYPGPQGHDHQPQQQRPQTVADQFREATSIVDMAVSMAERFRGPQASAEPEREPERDDSPVRVIDIGGWPVIMDKKDGSARKWETITANMGNVLKWVAEQREAMQKSANSRREPRQQLPPGYVEVTPGYQPPPGYVAVPVDQLPSQEELPQPPQHMPPPISQEERPAPQRSWGAPPMPGSGG